MKFHTMVCIAVGVGLLGCASSNPPLMFGDSTTFGIRIGNDTATGGASVSLGLKAQSVALVPITYNDDDGNARSLKAHGQGQGDLRDAMSVFAVFESAAPPTGAASAPRVGLGQIFSTGLAAQDITRGYLCRAKGINDCAPAPTAADQSALAAAAMANSAATDARNAAEAADSAAKQVAGAIKSGKVAVMATPAPKTYNADDAPYQRPLVFLRTDVLGFDIGGSLAEKGLQFVLGYTNRNVAFIPTYTQGANGAVGRISSGDDSKDGPRDTLSVIGQFKASTATTQLGYDLERFFATGVAARYLGQAAGSAVAKQPLPGASTPSQAK